MQATTGTAAWWRSGAVNARLTEASNDFGLAADQLADTEVSVDPALIARAKGWSTDRPTLDRLRADRDRVLRLLGALDHLIEARGLGEGPPHEGWFSKGDGSKWERVKNERGKIRTNHSAG